MVTPPETDVARTSVGPLQTLNRRAALGAPIDDEFVDALIPILAENGGRTLGRARLWHQQFYGAPNGIKIHAIEIHAHDANRFVVRIAQCHTHCTDPATVSAGLPVRTDEPVVG